MGIKTNDKTGLIGKTGYIDDKAGLIKGTEDLIEKGGWIKVLPLDEKNWDDYEGF